MITTTLREGPSMDMYPRHQTCEWVEQADGLSARVCEDGQIMMWRDDQHNVWLPNEKAPSKWHKFFERARFGDAVSPLPGICTQAPHRPIPLAKIRRLQNALRGLAERVHEPALRVVADGLLGTHTVMMTNHAMVRYVGSPPELSTGSLSHAQVSAFAPHLASYIEKAPVLAPQQASATPSPVAQQQYAQPSGAPTMPQYNDDPGYYQPQPAVYYPPQSGYGPGPGYGPGYGPHRAPGGLPGDRASLDVKAFVPAQYEHIRMEPTTALLLVCGGLAAIWYLTKDKKKKEA